MLAARLVDEKELVLVQRGQAFFHVSGAGHEAVAALAPHLTGDDWLHCHYRDKALLLLRGVPISRFFTGLLCKADSCSEGRQMSAHLSDPSLNVLSMVGPVGNNALQAVGVAAVVRDRPGSAVVHCSVGDGTTQEGEFLEACGEAALLPSGKALLTLVNSSDGCELAQWPAGDWNARDREMMTRTGPGP